MRKERRLCVIDKINKVINKQFQYEYFHEHAFIREDVDNMITYRFRPTNTAKRDLILENNINKIKQLNVGEVTFAKISGLGAYIIIDYRPKKLRESDLLNKKKEYDEIIKKLTDEVNHTYYDDYYEDD